MRDNLFMIDILIKLIFLMLLAILLDITDTLWSVGKNIAVILWLVELMIKLGWIF